MAASEISVTTMTRDGIAISTATLTAWDTNGMYFSNLIENRTILVAKNAATASQTLVIDLLPGDTVDDQAVTDRSVAVAAGGTTLIGPFPSEYYNDTAGRVQLVSAALTTFYVGAFRV